MPSPCPELSLQTSGRFPLSDSQPHFGCMLQQHLPVFPPFSLSSPSLCPSLKGLNLVCLSCSNCSQSHIPCLPATLSTLFATMASTAAHSSTSPIGGLGPEASFPSCHSWNLACMQGAHFCAFCFVFLHILSLFLHMNTCTQEQ